MRVDRAAGQPFVYVEKGEVIDRTVSALIGG